MFKTNGPRGFQGIWKKPETLTKGGLGFVLSAASLRHKVVSEYHVIVSVRDRTLPPPPGFLLETASRLVRNRSLLLPVVLWSTISPTMRARHQVARRLMLTAVSIELEVVSVARFPPGRSSCEALVSTEAEVVPA